MKPDPPRDEAYWSNHDLWEWYGRGECQRGFVRDSRFSRGDDPVIKGTSRTKSRDLRKSAPYQSLFKPESGAA